MGWVGVDLDGTLAHDNDGDYGPGIIGKPVPKMVVKVKALLKKGIEVRIMTARVGVGSAVDLERAAIEKWCEQHIGQKLIVTCQKDYRMIELWDDRARQVIPNTGDFEKSWRVL